MNESPDAPSSRRALLRVAGATAVAGAAAGIAACGSGSNTSSTHSVKTPPPANQVEVQLLNGALELEYRAAALYTAITPLLKGRAHTAAKLFLEQELAHATKLAGLIGYAGGTPRKQRSNYDIGNAKGLRGAFELLVTLENAQIAAYLDAITQLNTGTARAAVASILANDAQHLSVVQLILGHNPIPSAFVTGRE